MKRPKHLDPPAYLSESPPVPEPQRVHAPPTTGDEPLDPTRYGDWEKRGIAIDF